MYIHIHNIYILFTEIILLIELTLILTNHNHKMISYHDDDRNISNKS